MSDIFYNKSLSEGITRKWARHIREINERTRTISSSLEMKRLQTLLENGVPYKKRAEHYRLLCKEMGKTEVIIPYVYPKACKKNSPRGLAMMLRVNIYGQGYEEAFSIHNIIIDYNARRAYEEHYDDSGAGICIAFNSHHVFSRYIERENTEDIATAIVTFYDSVFNCIRQIANKTGPCNLLLSNGGMLLGEVEERKNEDNRYLAHTYISRAQVQGHNFENLITPCPERLGHIIEKPIVNLSKNQGEIAKSYGNTEMIEQLILHNVMTIKQDITDFR
ncbi:hypothetical protein ACP3V3_19625 [Vibrio sp. PNB22_3_1]